MVTLSLQSFCGSKTLTRKWMVLRNALSVTALCTNQTGLYPVCSAETARTSSTLPAFASGLILLTSPTVLCARLSSSSEINLKFNMENLDIFELKNSDDIKNYEQRFAIFRLETYIA